VQQIQPLQSLVPSPPGQQPIPMDQSQQAAPPPTPGGDLQTYARAAAQRAGIDPDIFVAQIQQESGFNPQAKSPVGATGIAQFMPGTAAGMGIDPTDPYASLDAAARMDAQNLQKYGGDWSKTLAAYNAGGGNVDKYGGVPPFSETQSYVQSILGAGAQTAKNVVQQGVQGAQQAVQGVVGADWQALAREASSGNPVTISARLAVLKAAAEFGASRPDLKSSEVLKIADSWIRWVEGE